MFGEEDEVLITPFDKTFLRHKKLPVGVSRLEFEELKLYFNELVRTVQIQQEMIAALQEALNK